MEFKRRIDEYDKVIQFALEELELRKNAFKIQQANPGKIAETAQYAYEIEPDMMVQRVAEWEFSLRKQEYQILKEVDRIKNDKAMLIVEQEKELKGDE